MIYSPHTITFDTNNRMITTVIRQNDLAIVTKTKPLPTNSTVKNKPRLIQMVACKTIIEYQTKQRKLRNLY